MWHDEFVRQERDMARHASGNAGTAALGGQLLRCGAHAHGTGALPWPLRSGEARLLRPLPAHGAALGALDLHGRAVRAAERAYFLPEGAGTAGQAPAAEPRPR